jgi:hypothetical protein
MPLISQEMNSGKTPKSHTATSSAALLHSIIVVAGEEEQALLRLFDGTSAADSCIMRIRARSGETQVIQWPEGLDAPHGLHAVLTGEDAYGYVVWKGKA